MRWLRPQLVQRSVAGWTDAASEALGLSTRAQRSAICSQCRHCSTRTSTRLQHSYRNNPIPTVRPLPNTPNSFLISTTFRRYESTSPPPGSSASFPSTPKAASSDLPSAASARRSPLTKRFSHIMDHLQSSIFIASARLNDLTGYSGIEALKRDIEAQETAAKAARASLQALKTRYTEAIATRSASQREVNSLLQRKHAWDSRDLERFTELYRNDHANEVAEQEAQTALSDAERAAEEASAKLGASILARYHEEQIWSDKIRRMSTWGTWGLMGVNVLLFLVVSVVVEPWRRKRLVRGFEEKVQEALEREGVRGRESVGMAIKSIGQVGVVKSEVFDQAVQTEPEGPEAEEVLATMAEAVRQESVESPSTKQPSGLLGLPTLAEAREMAEAKVDDLFSERRVTVRRVELTAATLEGAFYGIAIASIFAAIIRGR